LEVLSISLGVFSELIFEVFTSLICVADFKVDFVEADITVCASSSLLIRD